MYSNFMVHINHWRLEKCDNSQVLLQNDGHIRQIFYFVQVWRRNVAPSKVWRSRCKTSHNIAWRGREDTCRDSPLPQIWQLHLPEEGSCENFHLEQPRRYGLLWYDWIRLEGIYFFLICFQWPTPTRRSWWLAAKPVWTPVVASAPSAGMTFSPHLP